MKEETRERERGHEKKAGMEEETREPKKVAQERD